MAAARPRAVQIRRDLRALLSRTKAALAGRALAAEIPKAEFVQLDSRNHILLGNEPAWTGFKEAVLAFTGRPLAAVLARDRGFRV